MLARWRDRDVFAESVRRRAGAPQWGFYEGPPTANGPPGSHHVLARVFKDIFPRYKTMRGFYVERKGGWDCHGLPVELAVEAELGFTSKDDIERYGIAEFNARCREKVLSHVEDWNRLTERIGFWIDLDDRLPDARRRLHRVGVVGAEDDPRQGPAVREAEGRSLLPARSGRRCRATSSVSPASTRTSLDPSVYVRLPVAPCATARRPRG